MTRQEFTNLTHVNVSKEEYIAIETVYMSSDLDKFVFCNLWCKMNKSRVQEAKLNKKKMDLEDSYRGILYGILDRYNITKDFLGTEKAWNIETADFIKVYELKALNYFGVVKSELLSDTIFNIKRVLLG